MKRKILFRGKTKHSGEWIYGNLVDSGLTDPVTYYILTPDADNYDEIIEVLPETIGQNTGFSDSKNKEGFEGQKVKSTPYGTGFIGWSEETGGFYLDFGGEDWNTTMKHLKDCIIKDD